ncbi:MAG: type II toxin-antitoxin system VapC family toxin [Pyrinomonadaceae bacterium]
MRYLLDTHTFIWKMADSGRVPKSVYAATEDPANEVFISAVSLWEIAIKRRMRKLDLGGLENDDLIELAGKMGIATMALSPEEAVTYGNLTEDSHFDPFDRMLIWQAISRKMVLVSGDEQFQRFKPDGLKLLWK